MTFPTDPRSFKANCAVVLAGALLSGCASLAPQQTIALGADASAVCTKLIAPVAASSIGLPSGAASIDSATWVAASALAIAERGPTPAARVTPATPAYCKLVGRIAPVNASAPPIVFQINLPAQWNGRTVQYGGGGFNGVLITAVGLPPAHPFDVASPLAQGFATVGTDSGHQNAPGVAPQAFAMNDEALLNFAHASYKKVRDVSVAMTQRAYGRAPYKLYFMGSSEGGREALVMAQRYPADFDGIFSRVPVINWTGLQHVGLRDGLAARGDGWLSPAHTQLVHNAVLAACDAADGLVDGLVANPVGCRQRFDVTQLRCKAAPASTCLSDAQIKAVQTLQSPLRFGFDLANGVRDYPGRGPSGEALPANGPTGGWQAWWLGTAAPALPPVPANGIAWQYGGGAIQYFYARNAQADLLAYKPEAHEARVREVSALMDATNPDLSAFAARGGKLVMLENMADYAQSPYAGVAYFESVQAKMGQSATERFARLYSAPGVDHVGSGAPGNVDMLTVLTQWVETNKAPGNLKVVEQEVKPQFPAKRALPLCQWPLWPQYQSGDIAMAGSYQCAR